METEATVVIRVDHRSIEELRGNRLGGDRLRTSQEGICAHRALNESYCSRVSSSLFDSCCFVRAGLYGAVGSLAASGYDPDVAVDGGAADSLCAAELQHSD